MADILLIIVTDNPKRASLALLGCAVERLPSWIRVMSGPEISELQAGAPVLSIWFSDRSYAETLLRERRVEVALDNDFGKHHGRILDWIARRDAAEKEICDAYCAEVASQAEALAGAGTGAADQHPATTSPPSDLPFTEHPPEPSRQRQSRWT